MISRSRQRKHLVGARSFEMNGQGRSYEEQIERLRLGSVTHSVIRFGWAIGHALSMSHNKSSYQYTAICTVSTYCFVVNQYSNFEFLDLDSMHEINLPPSPNKISPNITQVKKFRYSQTQKTLEYSLANSFFIIYCSTNFPDNLRSAGDKISTRYNFITRSLC